MAANRKLIAQIEELEHKSRRQDVLVDDELIFAFYDQQVPADVTSGERFERWYRDEVKRQPRLLMLSREELMRHEAAGITTAAFPKTIRLGGIDCAAGYLHEPGHARDGVTVTVPIYALEPGERGTLRVARSGNAQGEGDRARQDLAAASAFTSRAASRVRRRVRRRRSASAKGASSTRSLRTRRRAAGCRFGAPTSSSSSSRRICE